MRVFLPVLAAHFLFAFALAYFQPKETVKKVPVRVKVHHPIAHLSEKVDAVLPIRIADEAPEERAAPSHEPVVEKEEAHVEAAIQEEKEEKREEKEEKREEKPVIEFKEDLPPPQPAPEPPKPTKPLAEKKEAPKKETAKKEAPKKTEVKKTESAKKNEPKKEAAKKQPSKPKADSAASSAKKPTPADSKPAKDPNREKVYALMQESLKNLSQAGGGKNSSGASATGKPASDLPALASEKLRFEESYQEALVSLLEERLQFPEKGNVKIRLSIKQDGKCKSLEVMQSASEKNTKYLQTALQNMLFPSLQKFFPKEDAHTFVITLKSEKSR